MKCNIGIYNLHMPAMGGGEKLTLVLAEHLSLAHDVRLFCTDELDVSSLEAFFGVDLSRVEIVRLTNPGRVSQLSAKVQRKSEQVLSQHHQLQLKQLNLDIFINNSYASELVCPAKRGIFMCMFPHAASANVIESYLKVVAISEFSADWVRKRWKRESEVIHPPCDDMGPPASKEKIIVHIGRFNGDSDHDECHHKGQELLLEAFKCMSDLHREGWQLHLTGSIGPDQNSRNFADALKQKADWCPVFFHFNSPRQEVRELYRRAAIYWHATGYGFQADRYPAKQEHFGISTVEAMTAAAVPVVYATGGQKEIVTNEVDGLSWDDIDGLVSQTRRLVYDAVLRCKLGQHATISSKRFSRGAFAARIDRLITELLAVR